MLQDTLNAIKAEFNKMPADITEPINQSIEDLVALGIANNALKIGDRAPKFDLTDQDGNHVSSASLLAHGPLVLTFSWCLVSLLQ